MDNGKITIFCCFTMNTTMLFEKLFFFLFFWLSQVLFHLLDRVRESSTTADKEKIESGGGNILIHHSRDTAEKQWAETWVLTLAGVARIFNTRRYLLQPLGKIYSLKLLKDTVINFLLLYILSVKVLGKNLNFRLKVCSVVSHLKCDENNWIFNSCSLELKIVSTDFVFCITILEVKSH